MPQLVAFARNHIQTAGGADDLVRYKFCRRLCVATAEVAYVVTGHETVAIWIPNTLLNACEWQRAGVTQLCLKVAVLFSVVVDDEIIPIVDIKAVQDIQLII
jgi:hypothetical protein